MNQLIIITGPTASGKTAFAIELAQKHQCAIISADSRQVYIEMNIGTAKPSTQELALVNHHFINHVSIQQEYNVGKYELEVEVFLKKYFETHTTVIVCGGTGLYIDAILYGIDSFPDVSIDIRMDIQAQYETKGLPWLQHEVQTKDPEYFMTVDTNNPRRLTRALEMIYSTGQTFSSLRTAQKKINNFEVSGFLLTLDRHILYDRINNRVEQMIDHGLEQEALDLHSQKHFKALQTVGYQEWFDFFEGKISRERAVEQIKQNSRNYAKRQITWMKRYENFEVLDLSKK